MSDYTNIHLDPAKMQLEWHPTPSEFALSLLGYIPKDTPRTWEEMDPFIRRITLDGILPQPKWGRMPEFEYR